MSFANDILDAIEIMVKQVVEDNATKIYTGVCKTIGTGNCVLTINGKDNTVKYYGGVPVVGTVYQVFIPFGNMSAAFIIVPGSGGGSGGSGVNSVNGKTGDVTLNAADVGLGNVDNIKQYSENNPPPYPVVSVNGQTGGVNLTASDVGAAPAGYGLGGSAKFITSGSLNDYKDCGWYAWDDGVSNVPFDYGSCIILNKGSSWIAHQIAISGYGQNICIRRYLTPTDSWDAWEWVNPPMQLGVEYRTTERYQGKPVYVKLVDFGKLPNTASKYVDPNISNFEKLIEPMTVTIYRSDTSVHGTPMVEDTKTYARSWFKMASGGVVIRTMVDLSADSAVVKLKYTKTTD